MPRYTAIYARPDGDGLRDVATATIDAPSPQAATQEAAAQEARPMEGQSPEDQPLEGQPSDGQSGNASGSGLRLVAVVRGEPDVYGGDGSVLQETQEADPRAETFVTQLLQFEELGQIRLDARPPDGEEIVVYRAESNRVAYRIEGRQLVAEAGLPGLPDEFDAPIHLGPYRDDLHARAQG